MDEFILHIDFVLPWSRDAMTQDLTYHRVRQSLWDRLTRKLDEPAPLPPYILGVDKWLPTLRQFLTARNEAITDNMRLAFDVALRELRTAARRVSAFQAPPGPPSSNASQSDPS